jgi:hypothetical protein
VSKVSLWNLDPARYQRHSLHSEERAWVEKNCYVDLLIEVVHAQRLDPMALLPFTVRVDFEVDQWTFYKPPHGDLLSLYGLDMQELTVYKRIVDHAAAHVAAGKVVLTEADAFFLPDTQGTDYRAQHTKTTIGIETIDIDAKKLGYFHNAGYYTLEGPDFVGLFRLDLPPDPTFMPLFAEFMRVDRVERVPAPELAKRSIAILRRELSHRPATNPLTAFKHAFVKDVERLKGEGLAPYHQYAFATIRQCGSAFELASLYTKWLEQNGEAGLDKVAADFDQISASAKAMILKTARAVGAKKAVDFAPILESMEASWESAMHTLVARFV